MGLVGEAKMTVAFHEGEAFVKLSDLVVWLDTWAEDAETLDRSSHAIGFRSAVASLLLFSQAIERTA